MLEWTGGVGLTGVGPISNGSEKWTVRLTDTTTSVVTTETQSHIPGTDNAVDLGSASLGWRHVYAYDATFKDDVTVTDQLTTGRLRTGSASVDDDAAASFTPATAFGMFALFVEGARAATFAYNTATPAMTKLSGTADVVATTGVLAGTTGVDTEFTVSAHTDGKIYLENRLGASRTVFWTIIVG